MKLLFKYNTLLFCSFLFFGTGCANHVSVNSGIRVYSPSDIIADADKLDGQLVVVRGYVVIGPEERNIFDSKDGYISPKGACLGLSSSVDMFDKMQNRRMKTIKGIFRKNLCEKDDICLLWCSSSGIEVSNIVQ